MAKEKYISKCCGAEAKAVGTPDFLENDEVCTMHMECAKCKKPCDILPPKNRKKTRPTKKSKAIMVNMKNLVEVRLTKKGENILNKYFKFSKKNMLSGASGSLIRMALWEFVFIFGSHMFPGPNDVIVNNEIKILGI